MKKVNVSWNNATYIIELQYSATIEDFKDEFCKITGMRKDDDATLNYITIDGNVTTRHTEIFSKYLHSDSVIEIPNRVEYGNPSVQIASAAEMPYVFYIIFNGDLFLTFLPTTASIADMKLKIINMTGISPTHPHLHTFKIEGRHHDNARKLLSSIIFTSPTAIYLRDVTEPEAKNVLHYNFFIIWNNKCYIIPVNKMASFATLKHKIMKKTRIPVTHPSLRFLTLEGHFPCATDALYTLELNANIAIILRNRKIAPFEVKNVTIYVHFNSKLYVILMKNNDTIDKLNTEVSNVTLIPRSHPIIQNMTISGHKLKHFLYLADLHLYSLETYIYLRETNISIITDPININNSYIHINIIWADSSYDIIAPNFITIASVKQAIVYYTGMLSTNRALLNLVINGQLAVTDGVLLRELISNTNFIHINLNDLLINLPGSSKSQDYYKLNKNIKIYIIYDQRQHYTVINRTKTFYDLKLQIKRVLGLTSLPEAVLNLEIDGTVKNNSETLMILSHNSVTIIIEAESHESSMLPVQRKSDILKTFRVTLDNESHLIILSGNNTGEDLINCINTIMNVPLGQAFFQNIQVQGKCIPFYEQLGFSDQEDRKKLNVNIPPVEENLIQFSRQQIDNYNNRIKELSKNCPVMQLNVVDLKKKLLVLDLDQTLIDFPSDGYYTDEVQRPHLVEFLTEMYKYYNIILWSATAMQYIVNKVGVLLLDDNENFKFLAYIDIQAMPSITVAPSKMIRIKPLAMVWVIFDMFNETNTIMVDDVYTNFLLNPENGIVIKPYHIINYRHDTELSKLKIYLRSIALIHRDFRTIEKFNNVQ